MSLFLVIDLDPVAYTFNRSEEISVNRLRAMRNGDHILRCCVSGRRRPLHELCANTEIVGRDEYLILLDEAGESRVLDHRPELRFRRANDVLDDLIRRASDTRHRTLETGDRQRAMDRALRQLQQESRRLVSQKAKDRKKRLRQLRRSRARLVLMGSLA